MNLKRGESLVLRQKGSIGNETFSPALIINLNTRLFPDSNFAAESASKFQQTLCKTCPLFTACKPEVGSVPVGFGVILTGLVERLPTSLQNSKFGDFLTQLAGNMTRYLGTINSANEEPITTTGANCLNNEQVSTAKTKVLNTRA